MNKDILIFGGLLLDRYVYIDHWPERGQDALISDEKNYVGGCAINMAVTAHNLIESFCKDETSVHIVSMIGKDFIANEIRSYLKAHNLSDKFVFEEKGHTGSCMVFSEKNGERTFLTKKGVEESFTQDMKKEIIKEGAGAVGLTGYYLLGENAEEVIDCIRSLKAQGSWILFDPSPLVGEIPTSILRDAIALADLITPNSQEMHIIKKMTGDRTDLLEDLIIVSKEGSHGGRVICPQGHFSYEAKHCEAIDTTGAGDSFSGALLFGKISDMPLMESVNLASDCAAKTVQINGPHGFWKYNSKTGDAI